jgi:prevent-host-death family protein
MEIVNIYEAKAHFSRLLARVEAGEDILIARAGRPVARLSAIVDEVRTRTLGRDVGVLSIPDDFDAPLPAEVLRGFQG